MEGLNLEIYKYNPRYLVSVVAQNVQNAIHAVLFFSNLIMTKLNTSQIKLIGSIIVSPPHASRLYLHFEEMWSELSDNMSSIFCFQKSVRPHYSMLPWDCWLTTILSWRREQCTAKHKEIRHSNCLEIL